MKDSAAIAQLKKQRVLRGCYGRLGAVHHIHPRAPGKSLLGQQVMNEKCGELRDNPIIESKQTPSLGHVPAS